MSDLPAFHQIHVPNHLLFRRHDEAGSGQHRQALSFQRASACCEGVLLAVLRKIRASALAFCESFSFLNESSVSENNQDGQCADRGWHQRDRVSLSSISCRVA